MFPATISNVETLEELLSRPTPRVVEALSRFGGDLMLLGVAGKMGPSLARMARRAFDEAGLNRRVIGVSRFAGSDRGDLERWGIETIACDLLDEKQVAALPEVAGVVVMAGRKFGSTGDEPLTWAMNAWLPAVICRRFARSRLVAFSTGNVYGLSPVAAGGSKEDEELAPVGEYAQSCLARERMYEYFSRRDQIPLSLIRLNYACDLRYGVLVDLARKVRQRRPVELEMGWFNTIWQGDANALSLCAFDHLTVPPWVVNVTGQESISVRTVCSELGRRWNIPVEFVGQEAETALISRVDRATEFLGRPQVELSRLLDWVADWVERDQPILSKPTHFESRSGKF